MLVNKIGRDFIQPISELFFIAFETLEFFNDLEKNLRANIFSQMFVKEPVDTVLEDGIIMPVIQQGKRVITCLCLNNQIVVSRPFVGTIHYSKAPDFTGIMYHRNYKCA